MWELTAEEKYDSFKDSFSHCGWFLLEMDDKDLLYHLFEEFDTDAISFLHSDMLDPLRESGYINDEIAALCQRLRDLWLKLESGKKWNVEEIRHHPDWLELFRLSDTIRMKLTENKL